MKDRRAHIQQLAPEHRVTMLCALLGVSRSAYYAWREGKSPRQKEDARLSQALEAVFIEKRRTYGRVRLTHELRARGHACGERRVGRLMRARGLQARPRRRFRPQTTDSRHDSPIAPNGLPGDRRRRPGPMKSGSPTSPISRRAKAGCSWRWFWISTAGGSWAGPLAPR